MFRIPPKNANCLELYFPLFVQKSHKIQFKLYKTQSGIVKNGFQDPTFPLSIFLQTYSIFTTASLDDSYENSRIYLFYYAIEFQ